MIKIPFRPDELTGSDALWFDDWNQRAADATADVIRRWRTTGSVEFSASQQRLWGELKRWLLVTVFGGKCAYCERRFFKQSTDAEHYRPKAGVRRARSDGYAEVTTDGSEGPASCHPGYFWLALDWRNLVPACEGCNSRNGKLNQFPVQGSHLFPPPDPDLTPLPDSVTLNDVELPLLLHPYFDEPATHLRFGEFGVVVGLTERGRITVEVLDLNDEGQKRDRQSVISAAETKALMALANRRREISRAAASDQIFAEFTDDDDVASANAEYSAAVRAWLRYVLLGEKVGEGLT